MTNSYQNIFIALVVGSILGIGAYAMLTRAAPFLAQPLPVANQKPIVREALSPPTAWKRPGEASPSIATGITTRILFVGDMMLDRNVVARARRSGNLAYPFRRLPKDWVKSFDYTVANLEGPMTATRRPPEKSIDFQFDPAFLSILKEQGWDAFSQANNHALDQGHAGYEDSVRQLRQIGFLVFGHQVKDDAVALATTTVNGIKLAFLGFNSTDNPIDRTAARRVIAQAKHEADLVIAMPHWGSEYRDQADPQVVELSHWMIDQGVDVVIGGHPHWAQGIFQYKNKPIAYSLGNFVFDQDWSERTRQGLAIEMMIRDPKNVSFTLVPLQIDASQPHMVEGAEWEKRLEQTANISEEALRESIRKGTVEFAWDVRE